MRYLETIALKNGAECVLRGCEAGDARELYENFQKTHAETDFLLTAPEENPYDEEKERAWLTRKAESENEIEICALVDGKIVGSAGIRAVGNRGKVRHRAELGVSIERAHWGLGIGTALMRACVSCAKQAGYAQLELDAVVDNEHALALYRKFGFVEFGRNPMGFYSTKSGWQEVVLMRLPLKTRVKLVRAGMEDAERIWTMQTEAFRELLERYRDYETSPGCEPPEKVRTRLAQGFTFFYFIETPEGTAGAIRVVDRGDGTAKRISPLFVMEKFRGKGIAHAAMREAERIHGDANWELDTILQEKGNCHLYEKMGYRRTGKTEEVNERLTLVFYRKD